jgi:primosomal protein N' (replication factor Y)
VETKKPIIAQVVLDRALDKSFDYSVPEEMRESLAVGSQVVVPFGRSKARGFVVGLVDESPFDKLKAIGSLVGKEPLISAPILRLARWMAGYYLAPLEHSLRTVLPSAVRKEGAGFKQQLVATLCKDAPDRASLRSLGAKQTAAWEALEKADGSQYVSKLSNETGITTPSLRSMEKLGVLTIENATVGRDPTQGQVFLPTDPLKLNEEQVHALAKVKVSIDTLTPPVVLLFGVTGSGKTEVFLQGIQHAMDQGKGAIVLVPEISLTPQTVERFRGRFGDQIALLHSHLSEGERHDEWHRIQKGEARIVVGARSALFSPVKNLGLIVVDEEHEASYKQEESPRYHARDIAVMRGHLEGCSVLLGSATPSIESYQNVLSGKYAEAKMEKRVDDQRMPHIRVIDMKMEAAKEGGARVFSQDLIEAVRSRIARKEQVILFLNRRGFSTSMICPACGYVVECHWCSVAMTYHRQANELRCHVCGDVQHAPSRCPEEGCGSPEIKQRGIGTEKIEDMVGKFFKGARVLRVDSDTMRGKDAFQTLMRDFRSGKIDILVGTQMIAKGLHFPNVTLVGVVNADSTLHMPDFRAGERTFQLITQVAGRAGRGDVKGEVIVQTYTPFHPAIQAARRLAYEEFFDQELEFRREMFYPPFAHLMCVTFRGTKEERVRFTAETFVKAYREKIDPEKVVCSEAFPASIARIKANFRYQCIIRAARTSTMSQPMREVLATFKWPSDVRYALDVDAMSIR